MSYRVNAGELRHRITIRKPSVTQDDIGNEIVSWGDFVKTWAAAQNLHGSEYFAAAARQAEKTVKFKIRYVRGIDTTMRIVFRDKEYDIKSVDDITYRGIFLEIKALEV